MITYPKIKEGLAHINFNGVPIGILERLNEDYMIELFGLEEPIFIELKYKNLVSVLIKKAHETKDKFTLMKDLKLREYKLFTIHG